MSDDDLELMKQNNGDVCGEIGHDMVERKMIVMAESDRGGLVRMTHRVAHCCSGSWVYSPM